MSNWHAINYSNENATITSKPSCVIVRKPNSHGGHSVSIAYRDVSGVWRLDRAGWPTVQAERFEQWCEIPL